MATLALSGIGYFTLAVIALHFLRPDYNPLHRFVSEYAVGPFGWLMTSAFYGLSLGSLALTVALYQGVVKGGRSWVGLLLLGVWSLGTFVAGVFKTDLIAAPETPEGNLHSQASLLAFVSFILATFFLLRFIGDTRWKSYYRFSFPLSIVILLSFLAFFWTIITGQALVGFTQRVFLAAVLVWLMRTARRV